ncbi:hypothetical protein ACQF36_04395 [Streptomyces sp. Marseille-Q5077]|uniref:hypothetical protein n=1 Tax=Streptomyces sp. Marseille-Q5077 TaxID=3418995 RepID=UPI003D022939
MRGILAPARVLIAQQRHVDHLLGKAKAAGQGRASGRSSRPKTGEHVDPLFAMQVRRVAKIYVSGTIPPGISLNGGLLIADVRGHHGHRARSTIVGRLSNASR